MSSTRSECCSPPAECDPTEMLSPARAHAVVDLHDYHRAFLRRRQHAGSDGQYLRQFAV
ncbi:MAG: hypothetical protein N838_13965 [Thiohalocapsa sp. PB-PSB1]|nr:MAG: hypothetical protein N838_13965 [Thiohalocapsa sp. PB-PSB1]